MVDPKRIYIPIDQIQSLPRLASHCPPSPEMLGVDAVPPRVEGTDAEPPRVLDAAGQAFATPPVVCELCHKGFRCKEDLISHCNCMHGDFVEYRKHVFWKAENTDCTLKNGGKTDPYSALTRSFTDSPYQDQLSTTIAEVLIKRYRAEWKHAQSVQ